MANILVVYATFSGQTARITERIAQKLSEANHAVKVRSAADPKVLEDIDMQDAVILGGAVRYGRFPPSLETLVIDKAPMLAVRPNAFFSVSLAALKDPGVVTDCVEHLFAKAQWHPDDVASFAGALSYSAYSPFTRFMMKLIAFANHEPTDTSRDHEFTDWSAVDRFAVQFGERVSRLVVA